MKSTGTSQRGFLKMAAATGVAAGAGGTVIGAETPARDGQVAPNDRIQIALIGAGGQGQFDTRSALESPGVELVAAADVYDGRLAHVKERFGADVATTRDYTELLSRNDVAAVIIGTPDHWHRTIAIEAMNAGKDVYVEKPMVQSVDQGTQLVSAQTRTGRILQVGSQRVSSVLYDHARQIYESGRLGELNMIEAWWDRNSAIGAWQYTIPPDASPETVEWTRFLGEAPLREFDAKRMFRWRNYQDYGTGVAGDLFVHLFSGLHYIGRGDRTDANLLDRGAPVLEGRTRRGGCHAGAVRLSGDRCASGVHAGPAREFRRRRSGRVGVPVRWLRGGHERRWLGRCDPACAAKVSGLPSTRSRTRCSTSSSNGIEISIRLRAMS